MESAVLERRCVVHHRLAGAVGTGAHAASLDYIVACCDTSRRVQRGLRYI